METLVLVPRGNVEKNYDWGGRKISFENGIEQVQRTSISPRITFSFNTEGDKVMKTYLENFFNARSGNFEPFLWEYDGETYRCRFSEGSIKFTQIRANGGGGVVGYRVNVGLTVLKESET